MPPVSDRTPTLDTAETLDEHLAAVAHALRTKAGAGCPPSMVPTETELLTWLAGGAQDELDPLAEDAMTGYNLPVGEWRYGVMVRPRYGNRAIRFNRNSVDAMMSNPDFVATLSLDCRVLDGTLTVRSGRTGATAATGDGAVLQMNLPAEPICARWKDLDPQPRHPLAALVEAWQARPPEPRDVAPIIDSDARPLILPRTIAQVEDAADTYYLDRFPLAAHRAPHGQLLLGLGDDDKIGPTLPANLWNLGCGDVERRGAVVPLALRMVVASILHAPLGARHGDYPVRLTAGADPLTLRRFLEWVYPGAKFRPGEMYPRLVAAIELLNSKASEIIYRDENGRLWGRRPVTADVPYTYDTGLLDAPWPVVVHLPPGTGNGPPIRFDRLQRWARKDGNAACYHALINLAYRWWIEGKRLHPAAGGKHWLRRADPKVYDRMTDSLKDALFFPAGTGDRRREVRLADADKAIELLIQEGDAQAVDGRLLPPGIAPAE